MRRTKSHQLLPLLAASILFISPHILYGKEISIAAGMCRSSDLYSDLENNCILYRDIKANAWVYASIDKFESGIGAINISEVKCFKSSCFAVGSYNKKSDYGDEHPTPLILISQTNGRSWHKNESLSRLSASDQFRLKSIDCHDSHCVALSDTPIKNNPSQFFLVSHNNGMDWQNAHSLQQPSQFWRTEIKKIRHVDDKWFAIGDGYSRYAEPMLLSSKDDGENWQFESLKLGLPKDSEAHLKDLQCANSYCLISGTYTLHNPWSTYPLIVSNHNKGKDWQRNQQVPNLDGEIYYSINDMSCDDNRCVIAGSYSTKDTKRDHHGSSLNEPFLLETKDGQTWGYINPEWVQFKTGEFSSVSCVKDGCVAVGHSWIETPDGYKPYPMLVINDSKDSIWFHKDVTSIGLPLSLHCVRCDDQQCYVVGNYSKLTLIKSSEGRRSWTHENVNFNNGNDWVAESLKSFS